MLRPETGPRKAERALSINLHAMKTRLFGHPKLRARILRDYAVATAPTNPDEFAEAVVNQFDQAPVSSPLEQTLSDSDVFRAAVKALASNSRSWATFLRFERRLAGLLGEYDPAASHLAFEEGRLDVTQVAACLPGTSSTADARAIKAWAVLLNQRPNWYEGLTEAGREFMRLATERLGSPLPDSRLVLCIVGLLAGSLPTRRVPEALVKRRQHLLADRPNLPGMGYVLASEFFRNLHWNAFKPDRHVQRLFDRWLPGGAAQVQREVQSLQELLGRNTKDLSTYLTYSLIGIRATPEGIPHSVADNLVWLLGAYLEKKGKESDAVYVHW